MLGEILKILFLGQKHARPKRGVKPAFKNQRLLVVAVWRNKRYKDFGIERIIRLVIVLLQFVFPGLYVRHFSGRLGGVIGRKIGVEIYVVIKLFLPILFFKLNLCAFLVTAFIEAYMILETVVYLLSLVYLSNEYTEPISYRRSLTALLINYVEICLEFAVIYSYLDYLPSSAFGHKLHSAIQTIYFSCETSATIGYGDISPQSGVGQVFVMAQIFISVLFVVLFFNFFASKVQNTTYYNNPHH